MENILATMLILGFVAAVFMLIDTYYKNARKWGENFRRRR